ncbi:hypothetical protein F383_22870 [Gossypium arboreum]|uniref:Uncharacterized protein n=1 Tax=Gossypium arboreum TaxID=29729 RepID=A0A0B0P1D3_GOSAR|nr:hypothetical protein F383_18038 [Gossypium arboreum]KHG17166.1 hypothetical protein F383_22870 [Gossypium arboreum]
MCCRKEFSRTSNPLISI